MDDYEIGSINLSESSSKRPPSSDSFPDQRDRLLNLDGGELPRPRGHYTASMQPQPLTVLMSTLHGSGKTDPLHVALRPIQSNLLEAFYQYHATLTTTNWRQTPLFAALGSGCVSIEADIWLKNGDLFVGHTEHSLREDATLQSMYIEPLTRVLEVINSPLLPSQHASHPIGVFYNDPAQALTLLVDFKTPSREACPLLLEQLRPLREAGWLTHWNGTARVHRPIVIVASGLVDFETLIANTTYRDVFYDAPLDALEDESDWQGVTDDDTGPNSDTPGSGRYFKYNPSNCHFASAKLSKAIGSVIFSTLSPEQLDMVARQVRNARERGLIPRYWGTPRWPRGLRDAIWASLVKEEVGLLNVDDLRAMRKDHWGIWP